MDKQAEFISVEPANLAEAERVLAEAEQRNPGPWAEHARVTAWAAGKIAAACPGMDGDQAAFLGLLHDIGRRFGVTGMRHVLDGYHYLNELGWRKAARICLTHSYPIPDVRYGAVAWDGTSEELAVVQQFLSNHEYDDYDRLIQLCDALCMPSGVVVMEKRLVDVALRYGVNEFTVPKWRAYLELKEIFERKIGGSIYVLLQVKNN